MFGAALYLSALWRILPRRLTLWAGLAYPAVLVTIGHGQNALLTTGLLGWGLLLLPRRPVTAGILFGILAFKPQLALLAPVALIATGQWRAIGAAMFALLVLAIASDILFGSSVWVGFRENLPFAGKFSNLAWFPITNSHRSLPQSVFSVGRLSQHRPSRPSPPSDQPRSSSGVGGIRRIRRSGAPFSLRRCRSPRHSFWITISRSSPWPWYGSFKYRSAAARDLGNEPLGGKRDSSTCFPAHRRLYARPACPRRYRRPAAGDPCAHPTRWPRRRPSLNIRAAIRVGPPTTHPRAPIGRPQSYCAGVKTKSVVLRCASISAAFFSISSTRWSTISVPLRR